MATIGRASLTPNSPTKSEIDIVDEMVDIRASLPHPKLMVTTAPLRIRSLPGTESTSHTIAIDGAEIIWTGHSQVLASGAIWYQVRYQDPIKGLITGWVNSSYLQTPVHVPAPAADVDSSINIARSDVMARWLHYFTPAERAAYIAAEKQRLEAFWSEIRKLTIPLVFYQNYNPPVPIWSPDEPSVLLQNFAKIYAFDLANANLKMLDDQGGIAIGTVMLP